MISPYLDRPLVPLVLALRRMLAQIETELAGEKPEAAEQKHLRRRAALIRSLLAPRLVT